MINSDLIRLNNWGYVLRAKGDLPGAEALNRKALESLEQQLGPEHPVVLGALTNLCVCLLERAQDIAGAKSLCSRAIEATTRILGEEDPVTLRAINSEGLLCEIEGNFRDALFHYRKALAGHEKVLGARHPTTGIVRRNIERLQKKLHWLGYS